MRAAGGGAHPAGDPSCGGHLERLVGELQPAKPHVGVQQCGKAGPPPATTRPTSYQLSEIDRTSVQRGKVLFVSGKALAKANFLCRSLKDNELIWFWTAEEGSLVISDLVLPAEQTVTAGSCEASGRAAVRANLEVRGTGRRIVGGGHSHHKMKAYSSKTDVETLFELAAQQVGFSFDEHRVTTFSTHNIEEEMYFPTLQSARCSHCRAAYQLLSDDVVVTVIGPRSTNRKERKAWKRELEASVRTG